VLSAGLKIKYAPGMLQGFLVEALAIKGVGVAELSLAVKGHLDLWAQVPELQQGRVRGMVADLGDMEWFTPDWVIEAIRHRHPALASLFRGWKPAKTWLCRQVNTIRRELDKPDLL